MASITSGSEIVIRSIEFGRVLFFNGLFHRIEIRIKTSKHLADWEVLPLRRGDLDVYDALLNLYDRLLTLLHLIGRQYPIVGMTRKPKFGMVHLHRFIH